MPEQGSPATATDAANGDALTITTVEYRRLRTFGGYQNETVGATAQVAPGQCADGVLTALRSWVDRHLEDEDERHRLSDRVSELRWQADEYERRIARAGERWKSIIEFLEKLGIERPSDIPETLEDLPL